MKKDPKQSPRKNPKKTVIHCPLKKEKGAVVKSECPAISHVRNIRKKLNALQNTGKGDEQELAKLRDGLKKAKTEEQREKSCENCHHKQKKPAKPA